ncbi:glycosyltransferase family 4 protein [Microlunatus panaciterrae]|uniref:Phosphatidylinositol alpha-1,6-mannosyltransferase n=1 Tax=Microlunatus panaciterrae TaxID=400768 RepID=A0ABS2RMD2_9ACTN|nr:glycosyltransferase family 4 protein [Microlunatus panaciterrae]MBM7800159.1 phosphatidylinositol alpha-1,6-mannosyltransferase [Microlunatus panaciterrae]
MTGTLIVTNDFPPRIGGIESFVLQLARLLAERPEDRVTVLTSRVPGADALDSTLPFTVVRRHRLLLPTPLVAMEARRLLVSTGSTRVVFGAAAPLSLLAPTLRAAGAVRLLAVSHGHETWWAALPGARRLLRQMADGVDHLSAISDYTASRIAPALSPAARARMIRLAPPVDPAAFAPAAAGRPPGDRPRCIAVGRFVAQKGFSTLLDAWSLLLSRRHWPTPPELVLVGDGPDRGRLETQVTERNLTSTVRFTGSLPHPQIVHQLQQADVFALPVRTRLAGLNPEGLGLAFVEAAACGLPVVVGDSGGAAETLRHGETGYLVDPHDPYAIAARLDRLLAEPELARRMGAAGRALVLDRFGIDRARATLFDALDLPPAD